MGKEAHETLRRGSKLVDGRCKTLPMQAQGFYESLVINEDSSLVLAC